MQQDVNNIKKKSLTSFVWRMGEGVIAEGMTFIVGMILARLLMPEEFGLVALTGLVLAVVGVFANCGLGQALTQKKSVDDLDSNTVFYSGLVLSILLYIIVYLLSPFFAKIFHQPSISVLIRVSSSMMLFSSYNTVQTAEISRALDFKKFFYVGIISSFVSGIVGICMALSGMGVWSLIAQRMSYTLTKTITLNRIVKWFPKLQFSIERFRSLFSYGIKLMASGVIGMFFNQMKGFIIGIKYEPSDLSYYNRGESLPSILCNNIEGTVNQIMLPALSKLQDNPEAMKTGLRRSMSLSSFLLFPMMFGLAATSENIITILFSEKWLCAVPFLRVISIGYCFKILSSTNLMAINAIGRSDISLKLEFIKKPIFIILLFIGMYFGPLAIAMSVSINSIFAMTINAWPNRKLINYSLLEQWKDIFPQFLISVFMSILVGHLGLLDINIYVLFLAQVILGIGIYVGLAKLFKLEAFSYAERTIKELIKK